MSQCAWHNAVSLMSSNLVKIENRSCVGSGVLFQLPGSKRVKYVLRQGGK